MGATEVALEGGEEFLHLGAEGAERHQAIVDVAEREQEGEVVGRKEVDEGMLVETVALAGEALDAVAVDSMAEMSLGGYDEDLGCRCRGGTL